MDSSVLRGKRAFVTGASRGLGLEIARELARCGCSLFLTGRDVAALEALQHELATAHRGPVALGHADLAYPEQVAQVAEHAVQAMGGVDVLVNCAGVFPVNALADTSPEEFEACMALNLRAPFLLCQAFAPGMLARHWGRIVNIGSSSAYNGFRNTSVYCASKHALLGLSRALHDEMKEDGVRVFCISPGSVRTDMGRRVRNQTFDTFLDPREVAEYVSFVISFDTELVSEEVRLNRVVIK